MEIAICAIMSATAAFLQHLPPDSIQYQCIIAQIQQIKLYPSKKQKKQGGPSAALS